MSACVRQRRVRRPPCRPADGGARCHAPAFPLPVPLGDRRSSIWGDPAARIYPERCVERPKTACEPFVEVAAYRCVMWFGTAPGEPALRRSSSTTDARDGAPAGRAGHCPDEMASRGRRPRGRVREPSERRRDGRGSPATQYRFSRFRATIQRGPVQRQEWQIVQSQFDLRDLLP